MSSSSSKSVSKAGSKVRSRGNLASQQQEDAVVAFGGKMLFEADLLMKGVCVCERERERESLYVCVYSLCG